MIDQVQTTLYPGGILNTGFAFTWAQERMREARPADPADPNNGAALGLPADPGGRQDLRGQPGPAPRGRRPERKIRDNDHYVPEVADPLSPITFVDEIDVPVFMACQWTDEQTGGHCPTLAKHMTGTDKKWFTFTNGTHVDSLVPRSTTASTTSSSSTSRRRRRRHQVGGDPGHRAGRLPGDLRDRRTVGGSGGRP